MDCPLDIKLQYRPDPLCKHTVGVGDRVKGSSGAVGCVAMVLEPSAMVKLESGASVKIQMLELVLLPPDTKKCKIQKIAKSAPTNLLEAVISGPTQVGSSRCNTVTLNAYESTNPDSQDLKYKWIVPSSASNPPMTGLHDAVLKFSYLPPGNHTFGLQVTDSTGKTVRAKDFKMSVLPEAVPVVSLTCPVGVCRRTEDGTYEMKVNIYEPNSLELDVEIPLNCNGKSEDTESLRPIVWEENRVGTATVANKVWTSLQVYLSSVIVYR